MVLVGVVLDVEWVLNGFMLFNPWFYAVQPIIDKAPPVISYIWLLSIYYPYINHYIKHILTIIYYLNLNQLSIFVLAILFGDPTFWLLFPVLKTSC